MRSLAGTLAGIAILSAVLAAAQAQGYRPPRDAPAMDAGAQRTDGAAGLFAGFVFLNVATALWVPNQVITLALLWRYTDVPPPPEVAAPLMTAPEAPGTELAQEPPGAAPDEATTEIAPEPDLPRGAAPSTAIIPAPRPERAVEDAIADAVADSTEEAAPQAAALTAGEKDAFRVAVLQCWNVGSLGEQARKVRVAVSVAMRRDGKPDVGSIRMLDYQGGTEAAARQVFQAARRAIIRCGATGYDLPIAKYERWREIEMMFNPEGMRIE